MKLSKVLLIAVLLVGTMQMASAEEIDSGIQPDNLLYSIDIAVEKINLALTFSNEEKISKELDFAKERLSEARLMAEKRDMKTMKETVEEHGKLLADVKDRIKDIDGDPLRLRQYVQAEKEVEEYEQKADEEFRRIDLKNLRSLTIEGEGNFTEDQIEQIRMIVSNLRGQAGEIRTEVNNQETKLKIKMKNKTGKSDREIEDDLEKIEEKEGFKEIQKQRTLKLIEYLRDRSGEIISEARSSGISIPSAMIDDFNSSLTMAISEYDKGDYVGSIQHSDEASLQLERTNEWIDNEEGIKDEQDEHTLQTITELRDEYDGIVSEARSSGTSIPPTMIDAFNSAFAKAISESGNKNYSGSIQLSREAFLDLEKIKEWMAEQTGN